MSGSGRLPCERVERIDEAEDPLRGRLGKTFDVDGKTLADWTRAEGKGLRCGWAVFGATKSSFSMNDSHIISSDPELDRFPSFATELDKGESWLLRVGALRD